MALLIMARVFGYLRGKTKVPPAVLGAGGGFLDAVGGGGWGPLVASSLVASGDQPRLSIGSVIVAEFFVTIAVSMTFWAELDVSRYAKMAVGLAVGGALAAPLAGYIVRVLPVRWTMILVGIVVSGLTAVNLFQPSDSPDESASPRGPYAAGRSNSWRGPKNSKRTWAMGMPHFSSS